MIGNNEIKIKDYVQELFENAPKNRRTEEFKEELLANLLDKYYDLLQSNMDDEMAYNKVISSIGNIDNLFEKDLLEITKESWDKKKSAKITAISVMMYILCPVSVIVFGSIGFETLGVVIMFLLIAGATGLLIYNNMTKPQYMKQDDTLVEDFKEWKSTTNKSRRVRKSIESAMWAIITAIYLLISFTTGAWHITWIMFVIGAAIEKVIRAYFEYKEID
ncbi:permease prefix domain 1-containing protein [Terrisporobacter vanillatitrophus]|uniref:permease prefix domain 1-containing protein n=1 Tax=Terrisporobacter vanillatitrophus TaxID=3058402 RepID=UPI0033693095